MGSDFSSISTDVVLNSSETRTVWSSESAVIVQDRWNYVEALIDLTYPSTAEIIFRGIASAEDTLRLTEISIRDFIQEMIVGAIDFVRATGGMIYVEISTAKSVPEPVLLRAYVNRLNSSKSPALSFTGSDLQNTLRQSNPMPKRVFGSGNPTEIHSGFYSAKRTNDVFPCCRFLYD
ncbi:hypothetical protein PF011_g1177 [Phytophthora fragariae]|uniref:Uncharacterized protein n=1 Tax=Phytophthora fragariae TaxID=53985 RepID=A0A6A3MH25_9STRA|nr:hypothetical protein PF011_g1177 [Phytophthora fragariae]